MRLTYFNGDDMSRLHTAPLPTVPCADTRHFLADCLWLRIRREAEEMMANEIGRAHV